MNTSRQTTRTLRRTAALALLMSTPLLLVGCSSGPAHAGNIDSIRWDPSPAMHTLAKRDSDRINTHAYIKDSNLRMLSSDIDKAFFMDRPSRLYRGVKP